MIAKLLNFSDLSNLGTDHLKKHFVRIFTIGISGEPNHCLQILILTLFLLEKPELIKSQKIAVKTGFPPARVGHLWYLSDIYCLIVIPARAGIQEMML
jgi:hypothetical protein